MPPITQTGLGEATGMDSALLKNLVTAPDGGHFGGMELTKAAGLSEDESHGQTTFP